MQILAYILARFSEPSSYAGLGAALALLGLHLSDPILADLTQLLAAGCGLGVPLAVRGLVHDDLGTPGGALLGGGAPGGCECRAMGGEGFRKHAVERVSPAAVVLDDLVGDLCHREPRMGNDSDAEPV